MKSGLAQTCGRSFWIVESQGQVPGVGSSRVCVGGISARETPDQERKRTAFNAEARIVARKRWFNYQT